MEPPSHPSIHILNESGREIRTELLEDAVSSALVAHGKTSVEVTLLLTSDARIQDLNSRFRGIDDPTDVLTFPAEPLTPLSSGVDGFGDSSTFLGDVAIAVPYAERQSVVRGVTLEQELAYLAIHGALHLVGYDDEQDEDRAKMVQEMNRIAVAVGLPPDEDWHSILHGWDVGLEIDGADRGVES